MTAVQQLSRIAASRPPQVRIYKLDRGYSVYGWLCAKHLELRKQQGWEVMEDNDPPHELKCDDRNRGTCGPEMQP